MITPIPGDMLTSTAPTSREGIEKYLGSGMVKGIGPIYGNDEIPFKEAGAGA